jgi:hypothetical protein
MAGILAAYAEAAGAAAASVAVPAADAGAWDIKSLDGSWGTERSARMVQGSNKPMGPGDDTALI